MGHYSWDVIGGTSLWWDTRGGTTKVGHQRRAGFDKFDLPSIQTKPYMGRYRSKQDDLEKIFYGHVVDSFIPNKRSKAGKRFGFVKFINVFNEERLVDNLGTVWIGRYVASDINGASFGSVLKGNNGSLNNTSLAPSMVLDDECLVNHNLDLVVMGEVKYFHAINNLYGVLSKEGFLNELRSPEPDFVSKKQITWVDIEGVPLHVWSRLTLTKIGSRWGEVMDMEDCKDDCFARKRICIETAQEENILDKFKIIIRGKNFVVRAKELFVWSPTFKGDTHAEKDSSIPFLPGYTTDIVHSQSPVLEEHEKDTSRVMEDAQHVNVHASPGVESKTKTGGSVLEILDGIIKDPCYFRKDHHILSDNFVALYGTWIPKREKVLLISIYAPQSTTGKCTLWDYISSLVCGWNGLCMVMGDFNEVRCKEDRLGLIFNVQDHRPILLREVVTDYGPTLFRFYHSWFSFEGFDQMVRETWNNIVLDDCNVMIRFKKKLQILKKEIRIWIEVHDIQNSINQEGLQKAKIKWAVEGDENSKFFHGMINRRRANLAVKCIMVYGEWVDDPTRVKDEFKSHFASRFQAPNSNRCCLNFTFLKCLDTIQAEELESPISIEEVRKAVWGCGDNKSPGPDGFTAEFFRKYWDILGSDLCGSVPLVLALNGVLRSVGVYNLPRRRAVDAGIFKGLNIGTSFTMSHLFYANDAVFIGEWSNANISGITKILKCFSLLSGFKINLKKSHLLGVGLTNEVIEAAAENLGCATMKTPFKYLGVMVGGNCSKVQALEDTISKMPNAVLHMLESIHRNFFNGVHYDERKITWVKWSRILASKKYGGLGVSSFHALNRALLFKWIWRFISGDNSLWCRFIKAMHGNNLFKSSNFRSSNWFTIVREVFRLKDCGVDLLSHCHRRVRNGLCTKFWKDLWIGDTLLCELFPRIYALETNKDALVAEKLHSVSAAVMWAWDLNGEGVFRVRDVRGCIDEFFLPKADTATRWVKYVPIKVNIFVWKLFSWIVYLHGITCCIVVFLFRILCAQSALLLNRILRTSSSGVVWLRKLLGSFAGGGIYLGLALDHMMSGYRGSRPSG
nr:RNA-directed DNA polymerase, eukaryota [Tanacetum cinerariifolium]